MTTMTETPPENTLGVDTHRDTNMAAVLNSVGQQLDCREFPTTTEGNIALIEWAESFGPINKAGIEGTGSWGASLCRQAIKAGIDCVEVNHTNRQHRRRHGKSDTTDALGAARSVLSGESDGQPRGNNGLAEALRVNRVALSSATQARTVAINQLHSLRVAAPEQLKEQLRGLSGIKLVALVAALRPGTGFDQLTETKATMKSLGQRVQYFDNEIKGLKTRRQQIVDYAAPAELTCEVGVGPAVAADLLIAFGDNYQRIGSEAAFAALCGASPVDLSSGLHLNHRLNRGGDRQANCALYRIVITRMVYNEETRDFIAERISRGKSKRAAIRMLKRSIARHIWRLLQEHPPRLDNP